jgi:hypothetical protein
MIRSDFFRKLIRYFLLLLMAIIVIALGNKVVTEKNCSGCPGYDNCNGKSDCGKY